ncbi:MAG: hypothetical protein M3151_04905 [Actinomycetota bacterium]|nr:hypothetical protein [Actinomycetota bacterium]
MLTAKYKAGFLAATLLINLVLAGTLQVREARACSCAGTPSVKEGLRSSDAVFWGEAVSVEEQGLASSAPPFQNPVTFEVRESWKGVSQERVIVHGQGPEASCGLDFDEGKSYLVFAYHAGKGEGGPLETDLCTATSPLSGVEAAPRALGSPTDQLPDTGGPDAGSFGGGLTAAAVILFASLALTGAIHARKQKSARRP